MAMGEKVKELSHLLYEGEVRAFDFKTMPGWDEAVDADAVAEEIFKSMHRVGIAKDCQLADIFSA